MAGEILRFRKTAGDVPVIGITESGSEMFLTIAFVGSVEYDRADSEALAALLDQAAATVRRWAGGPAAVKE